MARNVGGKEAFRLDPCGDRGVSASWLMQAAHRSLRSRSWICTPGRPEGGEDNAPLGGRMERVTR